MNKHKKDTDLGVEDKKQVSLVGGYGGGDRGVFEKAKRRTCVGGYPEVHIVFRADTFENYNFGRKNQRTFYLRQMSLSVFLRGEIRETNSIFRVSKKLNVKIMCADGGLLARTQENPAAALSASPNH